jgi:hypothetical protein
MSYLTKSNSIGPLIQFLLNKLWAGFFDPSSGLYLPNILLNGDPSLGISSADPYNAKGPYDYKNVALPSNLQSGVCKVKDILGSPTANPDLILQNAQLVGVHAIEKNGDLLFYKDTPQFEAKVNFGTLKKVKIPIDIKAISSAEQMMIIDQPCKALKGYNSTVEADYDASITKMGLSVIASITEKSATELVITVDALSVSIDKSDLDLTIDVKGQSILSALINAAINSYKQSIINKMTQIANSQSVRSAISNFLTKEINSKLTAHIKEEQHEK